MNFPVPDYRPPPATEPPALVRDVARDVLWNRPVFKAPPLQLHPKLFDAISFSEDFRRIGFGAR